MLRGVKVLEVGGGLAGSYAGMLLGAAGADVIRLEVASDCWRLRSRWPDSTARTYITALDTWLNRGKRSIAFRDLPSASRYLGGLVAGVDVVLDDASPAQRRELQLPSEACPVERPWILITPYGLEHVNEVGCDLTVASLSGAVWAIGEPDREPLTVPHFQAAVGAGIIAATLAVAAAMDTGPPRLIDIAEMEVLGSYARVNSTLFEWEREGHRAARSGGAYPYTILPCKDGYVCLAGRTNGDWRRMLEALDCLDLAKDPRFSDVREIAKRYPEEADKQLKAVLANLSQEEVLSRATRFGCAMAPVRGFDDLAGDGELRASEAIVDEIVDGQRYTIPAFSWFGSAPIGAPPSVGQHGGDVVREILSGELAVSALADLSMPA